MRSLAGFLANQGYAVLNQGYASRSAPIERLAQETLPPAFAALVGRGVETIHVVTHSMGGILLRCYLAEHQPPWLGRVVMLSPPNQGSELVDRLRRFAWFRVLFGPAGCQLGTGKEALPIRLGAVDFPLGIIIGNRPAIGLSRFFPGPNDGKVSVQRARIDGMSDFLVLPCGHSLIMRKRPVKQQVLRFLRTGRFDH
ncbi:alpha/beta hydrolase [Desulfobulbus propionicus]|jgi:pimeloyl-ACP methyl ester carboxylesterase